MKAFNIQNTNSLKSQELEFRRERLRQLLEKDAENYKSSLANLTNYLKNKSELILKTEAIKKAREFEKLQVFYFIYFIFSYLTNF